MQYLATTNPGLESVAADEVRDLVGADPRRRYRGAIAFEADESAVYTLNRRARSLHRVLVVLVDAEFEGLDHVEDLVAGLPIERYVDADQSFGIRPTRHGDHEFTSVDVGDVTGQAVIDAHRAATGTRLEVDLDDPDVVFRAFVRDDAFLFTVDTTGERSLHHRWYRECEHNAPLRPTLAYQLLRLADFSRADSLLDPMCGSATIPIEAGLAALDRPVHAGRSWDFEHLPFLSPGDAALPAFERRDPAGIEPLRGIEVRDRWVRCGRVNVRAADLTDAVTVVQGDARDEPLDADVVVTNLPFGIRTESGDVPALYRDFSENLRGGDWRRFVALTTRPELLDVPIDRRIEVTYGRLDAAVVVARR